MVDSTVSPFVNNFNKLKERSESRHKMKYGKIEEENEKVKKDNKVESHMLLQFKKTNIAVWNRSGIQSGTP